MASRLDLYQELIFEQLNAKAWSYRTVAANLRAAVGVNISAQALRMWHISRTKKIKERNGRLGPGVRAVEFDVQPVPLGSPKGELIAEHLKAAEARVTSEALAKFIKKNTK